MSDERASLNPRPMAAQSPAPAPAAPAAAAAGPSAMAEPDLVGQVLDGRYQVMQRLGQGSMTTVYEARHSGSGRHFAIKVLQASYAAKPQSLDRFLQLARAAAQVRHKNVVAIEEFGYTPTGSVYASVELVVGQSLQTVLDQQGRWSWDQARPVAIQLAAALQAAHQAGVVHRALKPSNCFLILDPRGKRDPLVKVDDFGLAQVGMEATQSAPGSTTTTMFGDPEYMAPEQGMEGQVSPQSDVYALGVVMFRLLTGQVPFTSPNAFQTINMHANKPVPSMRQVDASIPEAVDAIVMRCLAKVPQQRFATAAELQQAFSAVAGASSVPAGAHAAPSAEGGNPRFAKMNAGGSNPTNSVRVPPPKQPSVIVAGSLGDSPPSGGHPPAGYPPSGGGISGELGQPGPPSGSPPLISPPPSSPSLPGVAISESTSSFLASRPGLRMGLGAGLGGDGPAPPATVAPGSAIAAPTSMVQLPPGGLAGLGLRLPEPASPPPVGGAGYPSSAAPPELPGGRGYPGSTSHVGAGMPPPDPLSAPPGSVGSGGHLPYGAGPGQPPPGPMGGPAGAGMGGGYPRSEGPGMPPASPMGGPMGGAGLGYPQSAGPGMPPSASPGGAGPGYPRSTGPGMPPLEPGAGQPGMGMGRGVGPGMPSRESMGGSPMGGGVGPGMPPLPGVGPGMPSPAGVGPGMPPPAGVGPGMPMPSAHGSSGPYSAASSSPSAPPHVEPPVLVDRVEYDDEDGPKRRPLLLIGIAFGVILGGVGLGWLLISGLEEDEGELSKVTRTEKNQDVDEDEPEPEPEPDEPEPEPEVVPTPKVIKKDVKKPLTFEQVLSAMKRRIRKECKNLGPGPITIDTLVVKDGGPALTPKVGPKNPVGECARRIVEATRFPASDSDHRVKESLDW
ncbi:MAG: protein kinase [Nannocystaceae bacterium]